nr:MAG TPA: hypothetical protein [Bacteriophage sp.]
MPRNQHYQPMCHRRYLLLTYPLISYPHPDVHRWCNMFEKIGVYGLVFIANVVLNGAKKQTH